MAADDSTLKRIVPVVHANEVEHRRQLAQAVNQVIDGKINAVGTFTLTANAVLTTLIDLRIGSSSTILLSPTTANAAAALASLYIVPTKESAAITHNNTADVDRTFRYAVFGG